MPYTLSGPELPPASGTVKKLVIFLHGVGSDGQDLIGLAPLMEQALPDVQFISPNGVEHYDMAPYGYQWFSLMDRSLPAMREGVKRAAPALNAFIDKQRDRFGLTDADVALVGFSQGSMMAMYTALRRPKPLAGVVAMSGALLDAESLAIELTSRCPVLVVHGTEDMVVPFQALELAEAALKLAGVEVTTLPRPGLGHGIDPEGIDAANAFLKRCFGLS